MVDLSTTYMGLSLKNPLLVASCSLTRDVDGVKKLADHGAGAVVLKSLFEEQVSREVSEGLESHMGPSWYQEAYDYVNRMGMEFGPRENLQLIEKAKKAVDIPVIASLNCVSDRWWKDYARKVEAAGADGLELNISFLASGLKRTAAEVEQLHYRILDRVKSSLSIPVAVKLGPFFTAFGAFAHELARRGVDALVLFNRFYQFDIDLQRRQVVAGNPLSSSSEMSLPLRWVALLSGRLSCDLSATTGVHTVEDVVKQILAGASTVQLCSALYQNGPGHLGAVLEGLQRWAGSQGLESLDQVRGSLSQEESENPELYERLQYIKALVGIE
ncbi:MAG: dihydroorotate dehydrogenase-like protein [Spirochaetota bacterium]